MRNRPFEISCRCTRPETVRTPNVERADRISKVNDICSYRSSRIRHRIAALWPFVYPHMKMKLTLISAWINDQNAKEIISIF